MGWQPGRAAAVEWSQPDPGGLQRGELEIWLKTFGGAKRSCDVWIPDIETRDIILKLPWIPQDVRDARTVVYLLRKAANRVEPAQEKEVCCSQQSWKELEIWRVLWHQTWRCRVWGLPSWFPVLLWFSIPSQCSLSSILEWWWTSCAMVWGKSVIYLLFYFDFAGVTA